MADKIKVAAVSGFPEWLPNVRLAEQQLIDTIRKQYELFGFAPIETPAVERMDVLTAKGGMQRQIFSVGRPQEDDDASTALGLHFDLTVPLARYVVQHAGDLVFPFRRYQIQKVWRGERAQRGRFREFYQCDVDIIGRQKLDLIHDAEIPCIINSTFEALSIPEFRVHVSNRRILGALLSAHGVGDDATVLVLREVDKLPKVGRDAVRAALVAEGLSEPAVAQVLDLTAASSIKAAREVLTRAKAETDGLDELASVIANAVSLGMPERRIRPDFTIARGLDYYTGTIYETFVVGKEDWGSVCSGGRYDDLASYFTSQKYPGVGVSIGLSRLLNLLIDSKYLEARSQTPTKVLVTMQDRSKYLADYLGLAKTLRSHGIPSEVYLDPDPLGEQIGYANSKGIRFAIIAGGRDFDNDTVQLKDLLHHSQETVAGDELVEYIDRKLAEG